MKYKNITKKNINIIQNGKKIIIKPHQIVDGDKATFEQYKGLLKINNPKLTIPQLPTTPIPQLSTTPIPQLPTLDEITVDYIIVETIN